MKRNTIFIIIMHSVQNHIITPISQKDKSVSLHNHQDQVKLFYMLQNMHTNYSQKTQVYKAINQNH